LHKREILPALPADNLSTMIVALAGGVGAARFLRGLVRVVPLEQVAVVSNTGDDDTFHGLHVSPDVDTVIYTLAGVADEERGWGLAGETWQVMEALEDLGGETWFRLGDRDLATHLYRSDRLRAGATLSQVTAELADSFRVKARVMPMSDEPVRTVVRLEGGEEVSFQHYFVRLGHAVRVSEVRFDGAGDASPAPGVLESIQEAELAVICPSNPLVSIGPILSVPGVRAALARRRESVVAVSPIVAGVALKGPAARMMEELGLEVSVVGVARLYAEVAATLVVDEADAHLAAEVEEAGMRCVVSRTVMDSAIASENLARVVLSA
jgi:LPPG:FO 2-phospho-L-lactate transferase